MDLSYPTGLIGTDRREPRKSVPLLIFDAFVTTDLSFLTLPRWIHASIRNASASSPPRCKGLPKLLVRGECQTIRTFLWPATVFSFGVRSEIVTASDRSRPIFMVCGSDE